MKTTLIIQVLGPKDPCKNCIATQKNAEDAVGRILFPNIEFEVIHNDIASKECLDKFGLLKSPAIAIRDLVLFQGMVPPVDKIAKKLADVVAMGVGNDISEHTTQTKGCGCGCK